MNSNEHHRSVQIELGICITLELGQRPSAVLAVIRESGDEPRAFCLEHQEGRLLLRILCSMPEVAALAIREHGFSFDTEPVVVVTTEMGAGALGHLVSAIDYEGIAIRYAFAHGVKDTLHMVLRTEDNPKAEDLIRSYLLLDNGTNLEIES